MTPARRAFEAATGTLLLLQATRARSVLNRLALLVTGAGLLYLGVSGRPALGSDRRLHITRTVLIDRPPEELYAFWRNFENLPDIMDHLEAVYVIDDMRSLWQAKSPLQGSVEWEAEITHEIPNREIGWRSLPGSEVDSVGVVRFEPSSLGHGTNLQVEMLYFPPAGRLGAIVAELLGRDPHRQIDEDLQRFKQRMESAPPHAHTAGFARETAAVAPDLRT
jgi:uncharacterized membrane protein